MQLSPAYVHLMDGLAFGAHPFVAAVGQYTLAKARAQLPATVALMGNCGFVVDAK